MLRAAIIEPTKEKREFIKAAIVGFDMEIKVSDYSNIYDYKENLDEEASSFDILLLNTTIHHEGDGILLASQVRNVNRKVMICFVTDSQRYYPEAFEVLATGYLLYPFDVGKLHNCISFYYHKTKVERRASWMIKEKGGNYRRIYCRNITWIESSNREIIIHLEDDTTVGCYMKMEEALKALPDKLFLRCHQSYIVSLYFVEELKKTAFYMRDREIPISRKYQAMAKDRYYDYIFEKI